MNEFYRHKKSDKIKWVLTGISFVLVFVMLIGMCLQLFGTGKVKPSEWFKKPETEQTTPVLDDNKPTGDNSVDGELSVTSANTKVMRLMATPMAASASDGVSSRSAGTVVSVTNPVDGYTYEWSLSSGGESSVTLSSTTGTSVTVTAKAAFSSPITLTCTPKLGEKAFSAASCTIGYYKRPAAVCYNGSYCADGTSISVAGSNIQNAFNSTKLDFSASLNSVVQYGAGTADYGLIACSAVITESTSGFSWTIGSMNIGNGGGLPNIPFSELLIRYENGVDTTSSEVESIKAGFARQPAAFFNVLYNGGNGLKGVKGKTFKVEYALASSDASRNTTLSFNLTIPDDWAVPYTASLNSSEVVL